MKNSLGEKGLTTNVAQCKDDTCGIIAHMYPPGPDSNRLIHTLPEFHGLSCFDIVHSKAAKGIWNIGQGKCATSVNHSHPIVKKLRQMHGVSESIMRKKETKKRSRDESDSHSQNTNSTQKSARCS